MTAVAMRPERAEGHHWRRGQACVLSLTWQGSELQQAAQHRVHCVFVRDRPGESWISLGRITQTMSLSPDQTVQRTGASRLAEDTNRTSLAAGSDRP